MEKIKKILEYFRSKDRFYNREMSGRMWVRIFMTAVCSLAVLWGILLYWTDPYMCWHRAVGVKQVYENGVAMIPGVLRHEDYDTVLIGTSLSQNALLSDMNGLFGCKSVKATLMGCGPSDLRQYITHASRHAELKHIILELNLFQFGTPFDQARWKEYAYLYRNQLLPVPYLLSSDSFSAVCNVFVTNLAGPGVKGATLQKDRNRMFSHKTYRMHYEFFQLAKEVHTRSVPLLAHDNNVMRTVLRDQIFKSIKENPQIRFDIYFPPVSVFAWTYANEIKMFEAHMTGREYAAEEILKYPNAVLHDCQPETEIIGNVNIYCDIMHYNPSINRKILQMIRDKTNVVRSADKIRSNNETIRRCMMKYYPMYLAIINSQADKKMLPNEIRQKFPDFFR